MLNHLGSIFLLIMSVPAYSLYAQETQQAETYKLLVSTRLATADVRVLESRSRAPLNGLAVGDFKVFDNDREQPITNFSVVSNDKRPLAVVLLLDLWWGYDKHVRDVLPPAARNVFAGLRPQDRVAIVTWGITEKHCDASFQVAQDFTADANMIADTLERLVQVQERARKVADDQCDVRHSNEAKRAVNAAFPEGQNGAIRLAIEKLALLDGYRREIIDFDHDYFPEPVESTNVQANALMRADVGFNLIKDSIFILEIVRGINAAEGGTLTHQTRDKVLNFYADETGGAAISPASREYGEALQQILNGVLSSYSLGWKAPTADDTFHQIRIELVDHKDATVRTRKAYFAAKGTTPAN